MENRIAIYLRVSSTQQDTASQEADLKRFAAAQECPVIWFKDTFTGKTMARPGFSQMMNAVERGEISTIAVWRLDRLGRTARGLTALFEQLQNRKTNLVSIRDGIDLGTSAGRLMAHVLASIAQYETEIRAERVHAGQQAAKARGKRWGGSKKGWAWKVKPEQVTAIREMIAAGKSKSEIARVTQLCRATIIRVLKTVAIGV